MPVKPDSTIQDVLAFLDEYRRRVDGGREADLSWHCRKAEVFERIAERSAKRGDMARAEEAFEIATRAARRTEPAAQQRRPKPPRRS